MTGVMVSVDGTTDRKAPEKVIFLPLIVFAVNQLPTVVLTLVFRPVAASA